MQENPPQTNWKAWLIGFIVFVLVFLAYSYYFMVKRNAGVEKVNQPIERQSRMY